MEGPDSRTEVHHRDYYLPKYFYYHQSELPNARELPNPYPGQHLMGQSHASPSATTPSQS